MKYCKLASCSLPAQQQLLWLPGVLLGYYWLLIHATVGESKVQQAQNLIPIEM